MGFSGDYYWPIRPLACGVLGARGRAAYALAPAHAPHTREERDGWEGLVITGQSLSHER